MINKNTAYKGYLIKETMHGFYISKDGHHIGGAYPTLVKAKAIIDELVDEPPRTRIVL